MIQQAVEAELAEFMAGYENRRLHDGRSAVVRNGYWPERSIQTGIGPVTVKVPKVRAKDGRAVAFRSALVPPYVRKTRTLEAGAAVTKYYDAAIACTEVRAWSVPHRLQKRPGR